MHEILQLFVGQVCPQTIGKHLGGSGGFRGVFVVVFENARNLFVGEVLPGELNLKKRKLSRTG